jgi:hypothetical protein
LEKEIAKMKRTIAPWIAKIEEAERRIIQIPIQEAKSRELKYHCPETEEECEMNCKELCQKR